MSNYSKKYIQLNDKDWLYQKYIVENLSTNQITKLIGAKTSNSVCQALRKFDIPVKSIHDGLTRNRITNFIINEDVITGCLLGDAGMRSHNKFSDNSFPYFYKKNKFKDHIEYVATCINIDISTIKYEPIKIKGYDTICDVYILRTLSSKELMPLYRKWYPSINNYKKIVPEDINITPTVLLHWFMDDGSTWYRKNRNGTPIVGVFSSESFTKDENTMLIEKIYKNTGLKLTLTKTNSGTKSRISIPTSQIQSFYEIIGQCPVPSLRYKWK